jgi:hypothetical protein
MRGAAFSPFQPPTAENDYAVFTRFMRQTRAVLFAAPGAACLLAARRYG